MKKKEKTVPDSLMEDIKKLSDYVSKHWGKPNFDREVAYKLFKTAYASKKNRKALMTAVNFQYYMANFLFLFRDTIFKWMGEKPVFQSDEFKGFMEELLEGQTLKSALDASSAFVWAGVLSASMMSVYRRKDGTINKVKLKAHMDQVVDMGINFCLDKFLKREEELAKEKNTVH
jgi:hypothetical protein